MNIHEIKFDDLVRYVVKIIKLEPHVAEFKVFEIEQWDMDNTYDIDKAKLCFGGYIKWDGCSNIKFNDEYMHLCGKLYWMQFSAILPQVYKWVTSNIENYDPDVGDI